MPFKFNWGTGIALAYSCFALATIGFVAFAMARPVDLVSPDYYAESLRQDARMQAVRNARDLQPAASIVQSSGRRVVVHVPAGQADSARGTITLYRPSDARADRVLDLAVDAAGRQDVSLEGLVAGHWILKLHWSASGRDFYVEQPVTAR